MDEIVLATIVIAAIAVGGLLMYSTWAIFKESYIQYKKKKGFLMVSKKPDKPFNFGDDMAWFAVRTADDVHVARTLNLKNPVRCNWLSATNYVFEMEAVFVTPALGKWVLVAGLAFGNEVEEQRTKYVTDILNKLSAEFGEAQFFDTSLGNCSFAKSLNGDMLRFYTYNFYTYESQDIGIATIEEYGYNFPKIKPWEINKDDHDYLERHNITIPSKYIIQEIAEKWSFNPLNIMRDYNVKGLGILGVLR